MSTEKEEEILEKYIKGTETGEDNKLRATIGSLTAKKTEELTESINAFPNAIRLEFYNLMINLGSHTDKLARNFSENMMGLSYNIETQVDKIIESNKQLEQSNVKNSEKTNRFTKVNIWLTVIIAFTGVIGLANIFLTNEIKNETIRTNQINEQPLLIFTDYNMAPYKVTNSGKGVAMNFLIVLYDKPNKQLYITSEGGIGEALAVDMSVSILPSELVKISSANANRIAIVARLLKETQKKDTAWFAIVYEDIYGNPYATLIRGPGGGYAENAKFLKL